MEAPLQLALPFSMKEAVSVRHASKILGVSLDTVYRMMNERRIEFMRRSERGVRLIRHASLVEYCDELMKIYEIPNRRPVLSNSLFRHADRDIPPFPLDQNMCVDDVVQILKFEKSRVIQLAQLGDLEAYHLLDNSPWRFYRPGVERFVSNIHLRSAARRRMIHVR